MSEQDDFELIPWTENFETGIPSIDGQHRHLVDLVNELAIHLSRGSEFIELQKVFEALAAYADYHFSEEESIWKSAFGGDLWLEEHLGAHAAFLPKVLALKSEKEGREYERSVQEILKFLVGWLVYHILDNDMRMAKALHALEDGLSLGEAKERAILEMSGLMHTFVSTVFFMYKNLASRSLALIRATNEKVRAQEALLKREMETKGLRQLVQSMESTIKAMAATIEARSPFTAGHHRRVARLAQAIASEMGLSEDVVRGCFLAASIHDLGEIQIPSQILVKPGALKPTEYRMVQQHSRAGYDILKEIDFPWPIAKIILQHHERLDGSGYPDGLKGEEILIEAKIIAVADVIEAMSSHRPYRPAHSIEEALEEIRAGEGIRFDPRVVEVCTRLFREQAFSFSNVS